MPELSLQNIDQICRDIRKQEITFSHLCEELTDHICCDVEYEMQNGLNFIDAYRTVQMKMGKRRIKEIQQETLYAVDTKYRKMKNTMKFSGVAGTILFGFAALFKIQHWPGASILLTLGALILAFVFLPSSLVVLWKETQNRKRLFLFISAFFAGMLFIIGTVSKIQHWYGAGIILSLSLLCGALIFAPALLTYIIIDQENKTKKPVYILATVGIIFYMAGLLFKIQHWPLATILMVSGVIILGVIVFPIYTWQTWKGESNVNPGFIFIIIGTLLIIIPGALINLNLQNSYDNGYYPQQAQQQALFEYQCINNKVLIDQYRDSTCAPQMDQLHSKINGLLALINQIQNNMVAEAEGDPGKPAVNPVQIRETEFGPEVQFKNLSNPFHPSPVRDFLLPGCNSRDELNTSLTEFLKYASGMTSDNDIQKYKRMLEPANYFPAGIPENGELTLMSGLHSIELLKNSLLTVESGILSTLANK